MKPILSLLVLLSFFSVNAQNSFQDTLKQQIIKEWERAKVYTQEYLDAVPADKYGFRPTDSVRSFAQQMLHLAVANVGLGGVTASVKNSPVQKIMFSRDLEKTPSVQSKDSVAYFVNMSYDFVITSIRNMDFSKLGEMVTQATPGGVKVESRIAWLLKTFEHQTHHRGQCTVYIRLMGIKPPGERLF